MEIAQRQNQLKIAPKWIEFFLPFKKQKWIGFQDMVENGEEDRISELPDCLLLDILCLLPSTKDAIRTGALSKRWKYIWTLLPNLVFKSYRLRPAFFSFVNKTLTQCRQLKLKKFEVNTVYSSPFRCVVNNWIRYAISRNVEEFNLTLWRFAEHDFLLDQSFFINTCFTDLTLRGCIFIPIGAINWPELRSLCISIMNLNGDLIKNILSGSPQLETLELNDCYGYRRLDITSKSVKNLVLDGCYCYDSVEIKAPNILSLTIKGDLRKLSFVNMSSLVEANLDCQTWGYMHPTHKKVEEEILKGYILNLHHASELKIGINCSEVLYCLEAKGFVIPSNIKSLDASY